jgi:hypothetical protein
MLQQSERSLWKSARQLTVLSLLRDLQLLIIQYIQQHMALTLDITKDYYQQGEKRGEKRGLTNTAMEMLKKGFDKQVIVEITKLTAEEVEKLEKDLKKQKE